jgi:hypothetical protein
VRHREKGWGNTAKLWCGSYTCTTLNKKHFSSSQATSFKILGSWFEFVKYWAFFSFFCFVGGVVVVVSTS